MDTGSIGAAAGFFSSFLPTGAAVSRGHHGCHGCEARKPEGATDGTATLRYRRSERAALYIQTQEGDIVRVRIKVRDAATATVTDGSGTDAPAAEPTVNARSSVKVSFHVDGNLSADELAAIQDVVTQVGALADEFFAGDLPAAFASAQDLNIDGSQLARVGLRLSQRQSITYSGPVLPPPAATEQPAPAALPAPQPTAEAAPTAPADVAAPTAAGTDAATSAAPADAVTDAPTPEAPVSVPDATVPTTDAASAAPTSVAGDVLATIGSFLHQLLDALGAPAESNDAPTQVSLSLSLKLRLFASAVVNVAAAEPAASDGSGPAAAPLVADTLDALAAAHEPPLSTNA
jgi:hypothetical protein